MSTPPVQQSLLAMLLLRLPDLSGLIIAIVILLSIYQSQEARLATLTQKYFDLSQCTTIQRPQ